MSGFRIDGGQIDRSAPVSFSFDGKQMRGYKGDTLASALLANGVQLVGRSFKYHRPRGILTSGSEEPNALVELGKGAAQEPNTRATMVELFNGLSAKSQNRRGPLKYDIMAMNDLLAPFLGAGFYYKTFMWPAAFWEKLYEPFIRASAGLGRLSGKEDPDTYDHGYLHCDLLVIGAGAAGLQAALTAGRAGARVILADENFQLGGRLLDETSAIDGIASADWAAQTVAELAAMPNLRIMPRTTVYGAFDHGVHGALERKADHHLPAADGKPRQVLWRIYSRRAILSAGATERPIAFRNNDRPGIMLAGAVRAYANRFGVATGQRVVVFTNNDTGWTMAQELTELGLRIGAVVDSRADIPFQMRCATYKGGAIVDTRGRHGLAGVKIRDANGQEDWIDADCLAVSGGWSPNVHLTCHQRGKPVWNDDIVGFVPGGPLPVGMSVAGAACGVMTLGAGLASGHKIACDALADCGIAPKGKAATAEDEACAAAPFWHVAGKGRAWVDLQNDVTVKDIKQSQREGFHAVEHLKRYTTLGMATDQGKTSNIVGLAVMAEATGRTIGETGTTMFRPPYTPVPIGAFAGRARGKHFRPTRETFSHMWATEQGATFVEAGQWLRAQWYAHPGEAGWRDNVDREVLATRNSVGMCDVTTLGKIDVQGRDAAGFLNKVYANAFGKLAVGKVRYGLMLREDGIVADDGTAARLADTHFVVTTTTANAGPMFRHMEFCRQCLWPDMDVHLISTTDQWAQFAVAGPNARKTLAKAVDAPFDISNEAFPFMACAELTICGGVPARLFRISFSGELAYEIAVPSRYGDALARALMVMGEEFGITPYGTEALSIMRIEKGHPVAAELNGTTTAREIGLGRMVSKKKDSIGNIMSEREALNAQDGLALVGFRPLDKTQMLSAGAHFLAENAEAITANDEGYMTSVAYSPELGHSIGLGFLKRGADRMGETLRAVDLIRDTDIPVEIVSPHFIDPEGTRVRG